MPFPPPHPPLRASCPLVLTRRCRHNNTYQNVKHCSTGPLLDHAVRNSNFCSSPDINKINVVVGEQQQSFHVMFQLFVGTKRPQNQQLRRNNACHHTQGPKKHQTLPYAWQEIRSTFGFEITTHLVTETCMASCKSPWSLDPSKHSTIEDNSPDST